MKYLKYRSSFFKKQVKDAVIEKAVIALRSVIKDINEENIMTKYAKEFSSLIKSVSFKEYKEEIKNLLQELNSNIELNKQNLRTVREPIIPDAIEAISSNPNAVRFTDKKEFEDFASQQKYFSSSASHCFYSMENMEYFHRNGSKYFDLDESDSIMVFNTGRELVQVWDDKNQLGYIVPGTY